VLAGNVSSNGPRVPNTTQRIRRRLGIARLHCERSEGRILWSLAKSSLPLYVEQPPQSRARKRSPEPFPPSRIRNREAAGYLMKVYLLTVSSAFFELRLLGLLRSSS
jgi:hypothetical protein